MPKSGKKQKKESVGADEIQLGGADASANGTLDGIYSPGFEQELTQEIPKVFGGDAAKQEKDGQSDADRMLRVRKILECVFLSLKAGDFQKSDSLCEQALGLDPRSGEAYLGKLMAELRVREVKDLLNQPKPFEANENYRKLMRLGTIELQESMKTIIRAINERNEEDSKNAVFSEAARMLEEAGTVIDCEKAAALFRTIMDHDGVENKLKECNDKAENIREADYRSACEWLSQGFARRAMAVFIELGDYRDSRKKIQECQNAINTNTYESAIALKNQKRWIEAVNAFDTLGDFKDSMEQAEECSRLLDEALLKEEEQNEQAGRAIRRRLIAKRILLIGIAVILVAGGLVLFALNVLLPEQKYRQASAMMKAGRYQEAAAMFAELGDYRDVKYKMREAETALAVPTETATPAPTKTVTPVPTETATPAPTKTATPAPTKTVTPAPTKTVTPAPTKTVTPAPTETATPAPTDTATPAPTETVLTAAAADGQYFVGDHIAFGHYPQTDDETDQAPIEWRVLERDGRKALLISEYGLDCKPYNTNKTDVVWETSTLRKWLNGEFLKKAFTPEEQNAILTTEVDNGASQGGPAWNTDGGNNTRDMVFLLSCREAEKYFPDGETGKCAPTGYAVANNAWASDMYETNGRPACFWWLRSPGSSASYAAQISESGNCGELTVDNGYTAVRPAVWVTLDSKAFSAGTRSDSGDSGR